MNVLNNKWASRVYHARRRRNDRPPDWISERRLGVFVDGTASRGSEMVDMDWEEAATCHSRGRGDDLQPHFHQYEAQFQVGRITQTFEQSARLLASRSSIEQRRSGSSPRMATLRAAGFRASISWLAPHLDVNIVHDHCRKPPMR